MSRRCPTCGTSFTDDVFFCGNDGTVTIEEQPPDDHDRRLGQKLGGYIVVARVADGAMGRVYEGRHPVTKERVAIKVLHDPVARDAVAVERFKREYETADSLDHPHIVKVLEFGPTDDGSHFMTMEYLTGEELSERLRREGAQSPERVVRMGAQIAGALEHAHSFGVIHRDLKPDNVFLCESPDGDIVKLLDFGSVKLQMETGPKLTAFGTTLGSPYYMSPEQAMGKQIDPRTDVFALSAILYESITGRIAFEGATVAEILMKIVNGTPMPASHLRPMLPAAFDDVIEKGVRKDKQHRYPSTTALAQAVGQAFGLTGTPNDWASAPEAALASAISASIPPQAKAFGAPSVPPPVHAMPAVEAASHAMPHPPVAQLPMEPQPVSQLRMDSSLDSIPPGIPQTRGIGTVLVVGAVLFGLLVVVGALVAAYVLLG